MVLEGSSSAVSSGISVLAALVSTLLCSLPFPPSPFLLLYPSPSPGGLTPPTGTQHPHAGNDPAAGRKGFEAARPPSRREARQPAFCAATLYC